MAKRKRIAVELDSDVVERLTTLGKALGSVDVGDVVSVLAEVAASYRGDISSWAGELKVRRDHKKYSVFEELFFYGVSTWRELVSKVLSHLRARGRFELEDLDFDPESGHLELELVALEGSDLKADRVLVAWSPSGVYMEVYYYLEDGSEPPRPEERIDTDWSYLPDENALVLSYKGSRLSELPPIHRVDDVARNLLGGDRR